MATGGSRLEGAALRDVLTASIAGGNQVVTATSG